MLSFKLMFILGSFKNLVIFLLLVIYVEDFRLFCEMGYIYIDYYDIFDWFNVKFFLVCFKFGKI